MDLTVLSYHILSKICPTSHAFFPKRSRRPIHLPTFQKGVYRLLHVLHLLAVMTARGFPIPAFAFSYQNRLHCNRLTGYVQSNEGVLLSNLLHAMFMWELFDQYLIGSLNFSSVSSLLYNNLKYCVCLDLIACTYFCTGNLVLFYRKTSQHSYPLEWLPEVPYLCISPMRFLCDHMNCNLFS